MDKEKFRIKINDCIELGQKVLSDEYINFSFGNYCRAVERLRWLLVYYERSDSSVHGLHESIDQIKKFPLGWYHFTNFFDVKGHWGTSTYMTHYFWWKKAYRYIEKNEPVLKSMTEKLDAAVN